MDAHASLLSLIWGKVLRLCTFSQFQGSLLVAVNHPFLFCIFSCLGHIDLASSISALCEARQKPVPSQLTERGVVLDAHPSLFSQKEKFQIILISLGGELSWLVRGTDEAKVKLLCLSLLIQTFLILYSSGYLQLLTWNLYLS